MSEPKRDTNLGEATAQLVDSALKLSASVAQTVAEAATGKPQENRPGDTPLQSIVRHGTTAAGSLIATVMSAARATSAPKNGEAQSAPSPAPALRVAPGGSLRVPLSVDNPGQDVMAGIEPRLVDGDVQLPFSVGFAPATLTIEPKDFEKLNVLIDVPKDAPPGRYELAFTLSGQENQPISLPVEITPS